MVGEGEEMMDQEREVVEGCERKLSCCDFFFTVEVMAWAVTSVTQLGVNGLLVVLGVVAVGPCGEVFFVSF